MIVDTVAKARQVAQYLQNGADSAQIPADFRPMELWWAIKNGEAILSVVAPDGGAIARKTDIVVGPFTHEWFVPWTVGSTRSVYAQLFSDLAHAIANLGDGAVPIYWGQGGTIPTFAAQTLGAKSATTPDGLNVWWISANDAIATGKLP